MLRPFADGTLRMDQDVKLLLRVGPPKAHEVLVPNLDGFAGEDVIVAHLAQFVLLESDHFGRVGQPPTVFKAVHVERDILIREVSVEGFVCCSAAHDDPVVVLGTPTHVALPRHEFPAKFPTPGSRYESSHAT